MISDGDNDSSGKSSPVEMSVGTARDLRSVLRGFFFRRVPDRSEIEDLVQDVFVRIMRRGGLTDDDNQKAYAYRTAQSVLIDRARQRRARHADLHVEFVQNAHEEPTPSVEDDLIARQALGAAADSLEKLPERTRNIFLLRRVDGLSMSEIGDQLGISVSAVEKHMQRATLHLVKSRRRAQ